MTVNPIRAGVLRGFTESCRSWASDISQAVEAFPWDNAPRYLLRDRDGVYGREFCTRVEQRPLPIPETPGML